MKLFPVLFSVFSLLLIQACSSKDVNPAEAKANVSEATVSADRLLTLEIDGMVCEKGCGSSIRKELKATGAVSQCSFDFKEDRKTNTATVSFDKDKITADEIIQIISTMNEKQFSVKNSTSSPLDEKVTETETPGTTTSPSSETSKINVEEKAFEMPNLIKLFSRLIAQN